MASAKVVADSLEQSCTIGETHHAIAQGLMRKEDVYAELSEIVAGRKTGRESDAETILLWHRGLSTSDIALGATMLDKAKRMGIGQQLRYA